MSEEQKIPTKEELIAFFAEHQGFSGSKLNSNQDNS